MAKPLYETKAYKVCNYIYLFMISAFLFILVNIPFLASLYVYMLTKASIGFVYIFSILIGPSLVALISLMIDVIINKDFFNIAAKFFKNYKRSFMDGIYYWSIFCIAISILNYDRTNIGKFASNLSFLSPVFLILEILAVLFAIMTFIMISRFYLKITKVFKYSLYYAIKEINNLVLAAALIIVVGYMVMYLNILCIGFSGAAVYITVFLMRKSLIKIEENLKSRGEINVS